MPSRLGRRWMGRLPTQVAHTRSSVMRTSRRTILALLLGAIPLAPAFGFDGSPVNVPPPVAKEAPIAVTAPQPGTARVLSNRPVPPASIPNVKADAPATSVTSTALATPGLSSTSSLTSLQYAAEGGHPVA